MNMENNNELSTRNEDINSKRAELLNELYALKKYVKSTSSDVNAEQSTITSDGGNGRAYVKRNKGCNIYSGESNQPNNFGNFNNGFVNALVLGIIVFLTETLFLLIGYLLFK